jgi:Eukaryotic aspartyl protease
MRPLVAVLGVVTCVQIVLDNQRYFKIPLNRIELSIEEKKHQVSFLMGFQGLIETPNFLEIPSGKITLKNFSSSQYIGKVGVGSPPQYLDVIFDTGSANFWVNSKLCKDLACKTHSIYDRNLSETHEKLGYIINVEFGTGAIRGEINYDSVTLAGILVPHQAFGEITEEVGEVFLQGKFSGILGLGFPKMAAYNSEPVFDKIISQKYLQNNLFTFYYSDDEDSQIEFGRIDDTKFFGAMKWINVIEEYYWTIEIQDIRLGSKSLNLCPGGCKGAVDTGTSLLTAPQAGYKIVLENIKLDCQDLNNIPDLIFAIDGNDYAIKSKDFILTSYMDCTLGLMPLSVSKP